MSFPRFAGPVGCGLQGGGCRVEPRCLACDPCCHGPVYWFVFDVAPGRYVAEVFHVDGMDPTDRPGVT